jgi:hypothetical protein
MPFNVCETVEKIPRALMAMVKEDSTTYFIDTNENIQPHIEEIQYGLKYLNLSLYYGKLQ